MKAISIRQPWAWLILQGGKDIENRSWATKLRGRVLIHAAKGMTHKEYEDIELRVAMSIDPKIFVPAFDNLKRGGIIGSVDIIDCVSQSDSPWFTGPYGFVLANAEPMPFIPLSGRLGFFEVDEEQLRLALKETPLKFTKPIEV